MFGSPGTGKTTSLLKIFNEVLVRYPIESIAFISFSNAAINEICQRTNIPRRGKHSTWFNTLHGICLKLLMQTSHEEVVKTTFKDHNFVEGWQYRFCNEFNIPYEPYQRGTSDLLGNQAFSLWTAVVGEFYPQYQSIQRCLDIMCRIDPLKAQIIDSWIHYKRQNNIIDFNDMLIAAYREELKPDAEIIFLDEAQDLNALEFELVKSWISETSHAFIAGDDDQTIYSWKGAKADFLLNLKADKEIILERSHRLPLKILEYANMISSQIKQRKPKKIKPASDGGVVLTGFSSLEDLTIQAARTAMKTNETVYLLLRTNHLVKAAEKILLEHNIPFKTLQGRSIWDEELLTAWNVIAKLRRGIKLTMDELKWLIKHLREGILDKEAILASLNQNVHPIQLYDLFKRYHVDALIDESSFKHRKTLEIALHASNPIAGDINLYVGTIHSAKGKEADYVFLGDAITKTIEQAVFNNFNGERDSEFRVFYVGATRAKKALIVSQLMGFKPFLANEIPQAQVLPYA